MIQCNDKDEFKIIMLVRQEMRCKIHNALLRIMCGQNSALIRVDKTPVCIKNIELVQTNHYHAAIEFWTDWKEWSRLLCEAQRNITDFNTFSMKYWFKANKEKLDDLFDCGWNIPPKCKKATNLFNNESLSAPYQIRIIRTK